MHWKTPTSPRAKKARMSKSQFKAMMIVFFDIHRIVYLHWVPEGQTINQHYYLEVLGNLRERIRKKTTRNVEGRVMNFPPRQCASSFRVICQEIPGQTQHPSVRASTLLARPGTM
ncbi:putative mariner transposase [Trichonephila clavipes]|nr:putative mariner transposase [Trichonephila clavipes]